MSAVHKVRETPLAAALRYAAIGWAVIPIRPGSKVPLLEEWQEKATDDVSIVRQWWQRWPNAGIGVHCGRSDLVVIDIDPRNGGRETMAELEADRGALWDHDCAIARTGGGGLHYVFTAPEGTRLPGKHGAGVDVLHDNRFFIVEPSVHPVTGRAYQWERGCAPFNLRALPELPEAWRTRADTPCTSLDPTDALANLPPQPLDDTDENRERVKSAAAVLSADCDYQEWMRRVFAILSTGLSDAESIAREWSMTADDRFDDRAFDALVDSYKEERRHGGDLIGPGTLFHLAKQAGWTDPRARRDDDQEGRFHLIPAHEFTSAAPVSWLVRALIQRDGLGVLYGEPGSGKSFFVLDLSGAIAQGVDWRGLAVTGGTVVYIAAEGAGGFRKRLQALAKHHGVKLEELPFWVIADAPNLLKDDDKPLAREIRAAGGASLIVVDTLASVTPGGNENAAEDMGAVIGRCKRLQAETGAFVLLIHHSGKNAANGARGWSGLRGAVDLEIEVTRDGDDRAARVTKQKDGEDGAVFPFRLQVVDLGTDEAGEPITSCAVEHVTELPAEKTNKPRKPGGKNQRIVFEVVEKHGPCSVDNVLTIAANHMIRDPQSKKDKRRDRAREALEALTTGKFVIQGNDDVIRLYGTAGDEWDVEADAREPEFEGDS
ncbi:MAG TPA: AAA family ATPase [Aromatoleum sp.]|uniref:AAA family ATPase n=1 Tax=Aromatoleum sp. TaxID=2307007 RepID=UPI002B47A0C5|nr:AAA family ATPase [Aromatoleum sp.]HJV26857.1 AAA family ATPase [Aromatoleum sp.]